eukprot:8165470-Pyramimonas_sp.AAC.1
MEDGSTFQLSVASPSALLAHACASHPLWARFLHARIGPVGGAPKQSKIAAWGDETTGGNQLRPDH